MEFSSVQDIFLSTVFLSCTKWIIGLLKCTEMNQNIMHVINLQSVSQKFFRIFFFYLIKGKGEACH